MKCKKWTYIYLFFGCLVYGYPDQYYIGSIGDKYVHLEIDKKSWDEVTHDFFEAIDNAVTEVTFDELFSGIEHP